MLELKEEILESRPGVYRACFPEVGGEYELTADWSVVQAVGDVAGIDFYFRAKHGRWEFETEDSQGHPFPEGHPNHFVRCGKYDREEPKAMTVEWSLSILRKCLGEFWDRPV